MVAAPEVAFGAAESLNFGRRGIATFSVTFVELLRMNGQPDAGIAGKENPVFHIAREQQKIPPAEQTFLRVDEPQTRFPLKNEYPFVPVLIVPFPFRSPLAAGYNSLDAKSGGITGTTEELIEAFRQGRIILYAVQRKYVVFHVRFPAVACR